MSEKHERRATGKIIVKTYEPTVFDEVPGGPALSDIRVTETFSGDIEGEGVVHFVQAGRAGGSATFVGIERVRGSIGGKKGTFLLQDRGTLVGTNVKGEWFVVPGSGTAELEGLRGEGGFEAALGQQASIWLDYHFESP
jgi:uncharacterized protein DUF3224